MTVCAWCGEPATTEIELEPVRMGSQKHPLTGESRRLPVQRAKTAWVCAAHANIRDRRGGREIPDPREAKVKSDQMDVYDVLRDINEEAA